MQVYKTRGVCSQAIQFELDGDTIKHVNFIGGCSGNARLEGIHCGPRPTSCPDQLAKALKEAANTSIQ